MKTYSKTTEETFVAFHIGRGGRFYNPGHLSFIDIDRSIRDFTDDLFINFPNILDFDKRLGYEHSYDGVPCILDLTSDHNFELLEEKYGITSDMLGEAEYYTDAGNSTGLKAEDAESGTGTINIDHAYNTTYVNLLKDCDENEMRLILESNSISDDVRDYCRDALGIQDESEDEQ